MANAPFNRLEARSSDSGSFHDVAKARLGDLGPGKGAIRPPKRLSVRAKTVVTQRRVGGAQSSMADRQWRT